MICKLTRLTPLPRTCMIQIHTKRQHGVYFKTLLRIVMSPHVPTDIWSFKDIDAKSSESLAL